MGTRALISINKKPFIATHWDDYPEGLGAELLDIDLTDKNFKRKILEVAETHLIDAINKRSSVAKEMIDKRFEEISKKTNGKYTAAQLKEMDKKGKMIGFTVMGAGDWAISSISRYGDFAEYQYDLTDGKWTYRELRGVCPESLENADDFEDLTKEVVAPAK